MKETRSELKVTILYVISTIRDRNGVTLFSAEN